MKPTKMKCVLVHGWGMNHAVWGPLLEQFPKSLEPVVLDLPGHGLRSAEGFQSLQDLVDDFSESVAGPALWLAWSLAGQVAVELALQRPEKVRALVLVASSPCFVQREGWACAMPAGVFDDFANGLERDFSGTIRRFLSLQVKGSESGRQLLRQLRQDILAQPEPDHRSLRNGLELLKTIDLRYRLKQLKIPVLWVLGGQDGLVKPSMREQVSRLLPNAQVTIYPKAAHAPFLSHSEQFLRELTEFVEEINDASLEQ